MIIKAKENKDETVGEILCDKCFKIITMVSYRITLLDIPEDRDKRMLYYMALNIRNNFMFDKLAFEKEAIIINDKHICKNCWDERKGTLEDLAKEFSS